jgi:hypothetical protein
MKITYPNILIREEVIADVVYFKFSTQLRIKVKNGIYKSMDMEILSRDLSSYNSLKTLVSQVIELTEKGDFTGFKIDNNQLDGT